MTAATGRSGATCRPARLDAAPYTAMPANVLRQVLAAGNTRIDTPSLVAASLAFDQRTYP